MSETPLIIVADTNILINFMNIGRLDLLVQHSHEFVITEHVREEITDCFAEQQLLLQSAIQNEDITEVQLTTLEELELFAQLTSVKRLGHGECSSIACAIHNGYIIAIDDKRATAEAQRVSADLTIMKTQDLVISMVDEKLISTEIADDMKKTWEEEHRFRLKIDSFSELISR